MIRNRFGKKFIGTALSLAMAVTAFPAMTALASENDPGVDSGIVEPAPVSSPITRDEVAARYDEVLNYYNENLDYIPDAARERWASTFSSVREMCDNFYAYSNSAGRAVNDLNEIYDTISLYVSQDEGITNENPEAREAACRDLYDTIDMMCIFGTNYFNEMEAANCLDDYISWVSFGMDVLNGNELFTTDEIIELNDTLNSIYASTVSSLLPEEIAPDYGMDPENVSPIVSVYPISETNSETIDESVSPNVSVEEISETISETVSVTVSDNSVSETISETSTQVLGAARDRRAIAESIVENLYNNVLNRASDAAGKSFWVNTILADENNIDMVVAGFVTSAEFTARNMSDDEFVALLYKTMFNRAPSASEKNLWMTALANGASRNAVVNAFVNSAESANAAAVYGL